MPQEANESEKIELTERELAIARGENPDDVGAGAKVDDAAVIANDALNSSEATAANKGSDGAEGSTEAAGSVTDGATSGQPGKEATPTGDGGGGTEASGSSGSPVEKSASWLKSEHRELAASYGIPDAELNQFSNEEEFQRAARIITRQFATAGQPKQAESQVAPAAPAGEKPATQAAAQRKLERLNLEKLKAEGYDQAALDLFAKQNDVIDYAEQQDQNLQQMREEFVQFQQQAAQVEHARRIDSFHDVVDSLNDNLFGKSAASDGQAVQLPEREDKNRERLWKACNEIVAGIQKTAQERGERPQIPPPRVLVKQAINYAFADDLRAEARKQVQNDVTEQSKRRRPVAASRAPNGTYAKTKEEPRTLTEMAKEVAERPDIVSFWNKTQQANGVA